MENGLKITSVSINLLEQPEGRLKAVARIVLNEAIQLTNLRIYDGANGLFVSYPVEFAQEGTEYRQIFYPIAKEFREEVEVAVLAEFETIREAQEKENV